MPDNYAAILGLLNKFKAFLKKDIRYRLYNEIVGEQWLEPEAMEKIQIERFNKLWNKARQNSKFFRDKASKLNLPNEIFSIIDLVSFPLLTRDDLQNHKQEIVYQYDDTLYSDSSGGSSGVPVDFYHDRYYDMFAEALYFIFLSWVGVSHTDKTAIFWGADRDFSEEPLKVKILNRIKRLKMLNSFKVSDETLDTFLAELHQFKPEFIYGYASSLELAAKRINQTNKYVIRPKGIRATAEMLHNFQKKEIEQAFKCPIYNFYGSREVNNLAAECSAHEGLHVFSSGRIIEIVDDKDKLLPKGEVGHIAITDLTNFAFPFIRYINGDMGSWADKPCSCGRSYPLLKGLAGRESDILSFGNKYIHTEFFAHLFYDKQDVRQFQIIKETENKLFVKIVAPHMEVDIGEIKNKIWHQAGKNIEINIQFVDEIETLESGKYRFTINNTLNR